MLPEHGTAAVRVPSADPAPARATLSRRLLASSARLVVVRIVALGLSFAISLFVARALGAAEFGRFEAWMAWVGLLSVAFGLGTDKMVVRYTAGYCARGDWGALRGLWYGLGGVVLVVSLGVAGLGGALWASGRTGIVPGGEAVVIGMVLVPAMVLLRLLQAALQGLDRVIWSQVADLVVLPVAFAATFVALRSLGAAGGARDALASQVAGALVAALTVGVVFWQSRPRELVNASRSVRLGEWWGQSWLLLVARLPADRRRAPRRAGVRSRRRSRRPRPLRGRTPHRRTGGGGRAGGERFGRAGRRAAPRAAATSAGCRCWRRAWRVGPRWPRPVPGWCWWGSARTC